MSYSIEFRIQNELNTWIDIWYVLSPIYEVVEYQDEFSWIIYILANETEYHGTA